MYGEPDYAPSCGGCRSTRSGLGFDPTPYLEAGVQVLKTFDGGSGPTSSAAPAAGPVPTGGGVSRSGCSMWPLEFVALALKNMSAQGLQTLQTSLSNSHVPGASVYDPASVQYWCAGGGDCNTSGDHPDVVAFNRIVWSLMQQQGAAPTLGQAPTQYPIQYGPTVSPIVQQVPQGTAPADQSTLDKILGLLSKAASSGLTAAENTVLQTGYQTLSPAQQAQVQRSVAPSLLKQYEVPLIAGGALLLVLLMTRK